MMDLRACRWNKILNSPARGAEKWQQVQRLSGFDRQSLIELRE
jgi:hypothetical protein